jgi:hypothetical protein
MYRVRWRLQAAWMVNHRERWNRAPTKLADFCDNEGHIVGEGTVPPGSWAVEDCPLHFRQCQRRRFVNQVFQTLHADHVIETVKNLDESIRRELGDRQAREQNDGRNQRYA